MSPLFYIQGTGIKFKITTTNFQNYVDAFDNRSKDTNVRNKTFGKLKYVCPCMFKVCYDSCCMSVAAPVACAVHCVIFFALLDLLFCYRFYMTCGSKSSILDKRITVTGQRNATNKVMIESTDRKSCRNLITSIH